MDNPLDMTIYSAHLDETYWRFIKKLACYRQGM